MALLHEKNFLYLILVLKLCSYICFGIEMFIVEILPTGIDKNNSKHLLILLNKHNLLRLLKFFFSIYFYFLLMSFLLKLLLSVSLEKDSIPEI